MVESRGSSVGIALGYGMDDRSSRVRFPAETGNFSLHHRVQNGSVATQPHIQWVPGALSLGVKQPGREADHSSLSTAEVKEGVELYLHSPNTPPWCGADLKHRDNFTFTFYLTMVSIELEGRSYLQRGLCPCIANTNFNPPR
jgi:hypothetical protein